jgi:hypothetical protein
MLGGSYHALGLSPEPSTELENLYKKFQDPDRKYSIRPFWFWNGELKGEELGKQIREMVEHGVYGAYVHNRDGLQTPYLSEAWWQAVGDALVAAREAGFSLCMVDEFEYPSGEARDYWLPGINKSRVVAANHDFHMRRLRPSETKVQGPSQVRIPLPEDTAAVVAARRLGPAWLDGDSLQLLPWVPGAREISWEAPEGEWVVITYGIEFATGVPHPGEVDLMREEAVAEFIKIYYEELHRRYGEFFGNTLPAIFADHEGDYGAKLPYTIKLFETFRRKAGYDLRKYLPALTHDIGRKTEKVRCDLLDTVSELYSESFFKQISDWCRQHRLEYSGHLWEESLYWGPSNQGDFFRALRSMSKPGCDSLVEWGRQSVYVKEVASVADFEGRRMVCENQGIQGADSYLSPEKMRLVSNCLAAWNVSEFIPHAFDYDLARVNYPPDWFRSQPYLPWFRCYADQMRRISFLNAESLHVAGLLLFYPQVSIWGQSLPAFQYDNFTDLLNDSNWSNDAVETSDQYLDLKLRLTNERFDYKIADDFYLQQSKLEGRQLRISTSHFHTLILPPMSTTRLSSAQRVRDFYRAGGTIIALRRLPTISVEHGRDDAELKAIWDEIFDTKPSLHAFQFRRNSVGGRSYFAWTVSDLLRVVRETTDPDVELLEGPTDHLYVLHKRHDQINFYWVVNDTAETRAYQLRFRAVGRAERWDAATGQRKPLFYQNQGDRTTVHLTLTAWDATYVVFDPAGPSQLLALSATNLGELYVVPASDAKVIVHGRATGGKDALFAELSDGPVRYRGEYHPKTALPFELTGNWKVTVDAPVIPLPYAQVRDDPQDCGLRERWASAGKDHLEWEELWLSPMNRSIRQWNVVGPFPNPGDHGLDESYPPEREIDYEGVFKGDDGQQLRWQLADAAADRIAGPSPDWKIGSIRAVGGAYGPSSNIVDYGKVLRLSPLRGTAYAQTNIYSPEAISAVTVLARPNPTAVFINGNKVYSQWIRPLYYGLTDGFAVRIPVELRAGWNSLLLKFLHNPKYPEPAQFTCRVEQADGSPIRGLLAGPRVPPSPSSRTQTGYRWLRFPVPPVAGALQVPHVQGAWLAFVDHEQVIPSAEISLPHGTGMVTLRVAADETLDHYFAFSPVPAFLPLGTWNIPGLENFSGQMTYEKDVEILASLLGERVLLDCGEVGVAAKVWVNGQLAGLRPWQPYVIDVTEYIHAGGNQFKVQVANTGANASAVGRSRYLLQHIDLNGWHGPARLVPYMDREFECHRA